MPRLTAVTRMYAFDVGMRCLVSRRKVGSKERPCMLTQHGACTVIGHIMCYQDPTYHIHWLIAHERGAGRDALQIMCNLADVFKIKLHLYPVPLQGGTFMADLDQLRRFYASFGFVEDHDQEGNLEMWRKSALFDKE